MPEATQGPSTGNNWLSHSVPLLSPSVSLSQPASRDTKMGLVDFVLVIILPDLPRWVRDRNSTEFRALYLFVLSASPTAVSARMKCGLNGLSRLCHITCFFTSTIRLRPRLSRALLLSLFSMPD